MRRFAVRFKNDKKKDFLMTGLGVVYVISEPGVFKIFNFGKEKITKTRTNLPLEAVNL